MVRNNIRVYNTIKIGHVMPYLKTDIGKPPIYSTTVARVYLEHVDCKQVQKQLRELGIIGQTEKANYGCFLKTPVENLRKIETMWETHHC
jgi:hypothetical protein